MSDRNPNQGDGRVGTNVQANLLRAHKHPDGRPRDRAFYLFFRKLSRPQQSGNEVNLQWLIPATRSEDGGDDAPVEKSEKPAPNPADDIPSIARSLGRNLLNADYPVLPPKETDDGGVDLFRLYLRLLLHDNEGDKTDDGLALRKAWRMRSGSKETDESHIAFEVAQYLQSTMDPSEIVRKWLTKRIDSRELVQDLIGSPRPLVQFIFRNNKADEAGVSMVPLFRKPAFLEILLSSIVDNEQISDDQLERLGYASAFLYSLVRTVLSAGDLLAGVLAAFGADDGKRGLFAFRGGLLATQFLELMRLASNVRLPRSEKDLPPLRGEIHNTDNGSTGPASLADTDDLRSRLPVNVAFTFSGLRAMGVHPDTLKSFPRAFQDGMAARAELLGDTGQNAPEHWDGALGLDLIHGYIDFSFPVDLATAVPEAVFAAMRRDVAEHTRGNTQRGAILRALVNAIYVSMGFKVVHIEYGEDPYRLEPHGAERAAPTHEQDVEPSDTEASVLAARTRYRREHFGFRDGLSQPFVDLGLENTWPGGGTPRRYRTWDPVAPGEIFLDQPDSAGVQHLQPANACLRKGSTYMVFRKLEQDVIGFRTFLRERRPDSEREQDRLAAQMFGRWQDGVSLVKSPEENVDYGDDADGQLNDFLYRADDPAGLKCPLGAHVRRTNPRDIGPSGAVSRHRILRRGISFGGPLLPECSLDQSTSRGLLFVAANARIETQFEVVQAAWINSGEFLGQAGLERCPIAGNNAGQAADRFFEAGEGAPLSSLPPFVCMRGGDYFFAPGLEALKKMKMATGNDFKPDADKPNGEHLEIGHGDIETPELFSERRMAHIGARILKREARAVRVKQPEAASDQGKHDLRHAVDRAHAPNPVVFVGQHRDVKKVLMMPEPHRKDTLRFAVRHYRESGRRISRGHDLYVGTEYGDTDAIAHKRERMSYILNAAWCALLGKHHGSCDPERDCNDAPKLLKDVVTDRLKRALSRTRPVGRIDLVHDLAIEAVYGVIEEVFGLPGPNWVTELAVALQFSKTHIGELHPDWLKAIRGEEPDNPNLLTTLTWSLVMFADVIGNVRSRKDLQMLSLQAGGEMLTHIDRLLVQARDMPRAEPRTLLDHFVHLAHQMVAKFQRYDPTYGHEQYFAEVRMLLMEITGTTLAATPFTFGSTMRFLLDHDIDLRAFPNDHFGDGTTVNQRLFYEATRLKPNIKMLMRQCIKTTDLDEWHDQPNPIAPSPEPASAGQTETHGSVPNDAVVDTREGDSWPPLPNACIKEHEWVGALIAAANLDPTVFPKPLLFSPFPGRHPSGGRAACPMRREQDYLLFGAIGEDACGNPTRNRSCWGRNRVALPVLDACMEAARRLGRLRRVAGPAGEPQEFVGVPISLWARFPRLR